MYSVHCTKSTTCTALFSALFLFWCTALILVREWSASVINSHSPSMCSHEEKHKHNPFSLIWWKDHYEIASELCGMFTLYRSKLHPLSNWRRLKVPSVRNICAKLCPVFFCSFLVFICQNWNEILMSWQNINRPIAFLKEYLFYCTASITFTIYTSLLRLFLVKICSLESPDAWKSILHFLTLQFDHHRHCHQGWTLERVVAR